MTRPRKMGTTIGGTSQSRKRKGVWFDIGQPPKNESPASAGLPIANERSTTFERAQQAKACYHVRYSERRVWLRSLGRSSGLHWKRSVCRT
jgi:hypothetical protein